MKPRTENLVVVSACLMLIVLALLCAPAMWRWALGLGCGV